MLETSLILESILLEDKSIIQSRNYLTYWLRITEICWDV